MTSLQVNPRYRALLFALETAAQFGENREAQLENHIKDIQDLAAEVRAIFLRQSMLLEVKAPITICGDVHGQFYDLLRLMNCGGAISNDNSYLFLGDYVDRGKQSLETLIYLLLCKVTHPDNFYLLRGNHECASINKVYGFYDECKNRFREARLGISLWKMFTNVFNVMPIAARVEGKIFCVHGGLSPELTKLEAINNLLRPTDVPETGLLSDLLWSDPSPDIDYWHNNDRGVSYTFGKEVVRSFCDKFGIELICRAHQVVEDGYEFFAGQRLITLFSAPNYGGEFDNSAAMMVVSATLECSIKVLKPTSTVVASARRASSPKPAKETRPKDSFSTSNQNRSNYGGEYSR
eukprot:gene17323-19875_t